MVNSQTKMCYQMSKAHNFGNNFCICSEQEVQLEISRITMKILKILKFVLLFSVSVLYTLFRHCLCLFSICRHSKFLIHVKQIYLERSTLLQSLGI